MPGDVSLDIGGALYYIEDRIKGLFGKDPDTVQWNQRLYRRAKTAIEQARYIQCIGMSQPVPIEQIYQPLHLRFWKDGEPKETDAVTLVKEGQSGIIFAGPGAGKSTLMNRLCIELLRLGSSAPFLFILRTPNAVVDLKDFVERLASGKRPAGTKKADLVLLIDGYDELSEQDRKAVSSVLGQFMALEEGVMILTCRRYYDVYDLKAQYYFLTEFGYEESRQFIKAFAALFRARIDAEALLAELHRRGFVELAAHPLMLTLICILKIGPIPDLPNNAIGLLKRAFDTLTLRWDQARGIYRHSANRLDGEERVRCLMRIAFDMTAIQFSEQALERAVRDHLRMIQRRGIDVRTLIMEMAQWYGVLLPTSDNNWQFVHRSIHDYLAARFWIESGRFDTHTISEWNMRAAYALCLGPDATAGLVLSINRGETLDMLRECIRNHAPFETKEVAQSVAQYLTRQRHGPLIDGLGRLHVTVPDVVTAASDRFLLHMIEEACERVSKGRDVLLFSGLAEAVRRKRLVDSRAIYDFARARAGTPLNRIVADGHPTGPEGFRVMDAFTSSVCSAVSS